LSRTNFAFHSPLSLLKPAPETLPRCPRLRNGLRQLAPGGKARAFADIVGDRLGQSEQRQFASLAQTLIPYATGDSLDLLGEIYGLARIGRSSVQADLSDQNFEFYVRRGTFGDINGGNDIEIPADIRITTGDPNGTLLRAPLSRTRPGKAKIAELCT
jgi:hypothetical protein